MKKRTTPVKKPQNSRKENNSVQEWSWFDYRNMLTGFNEPMNEIGVDKLAHELMLWAETDPDALKVSQFRLARGIKRSTWQDWCSKFESLREAHEYAKEIIGNRREIGAVQNKFNPGVVSYTMPFYDPEWKEETVRRASLKDGSNEAKTTITVLTNPIPSSPLVPERKKDTESGL